VALVASRQDTILNIPTHVFPWRRRDRCAGKPAILVQEPYDARPCLVHTRCNRQTRQRAIRNPDVWHHDNDHAVLMRSNRVCYDVHVDPGQPGMQPI